jgi:uncharacterized ferritin-like protein (DUF455 family)
MELRAAALQVLLMADPAAKAAAARSLLPAAGDTIDTGARLQPSAPLPGRPHKPELVQPSTLPKRSAFTPEGRAALLHAVAHIELNAINLALDAVWRFPALPTAYYEDWLQVAREEALHFTLLAEHLATLGHAYGDFAAHDGLWAMCERTAHDATARMALVPRTLEARGLDATPPMQVRLKKAGDLRAVQILDVILHDEVGHVAIGNRWYRWLCQQQGLEPVSHFERLQVLHQAPRPQPPFNLEARRQAGFWPAELERLAVAPLLRV